MPFFFILLAISFFSSAILWPNAIVSFTTSQPEGHVAFVEAVDEVNRVFYISHAGSGKSWYGIKAVSFDYPNIVGFVYLDLEK